ncbi:hypothetical protein DBR40_07250 [Pedobacter sp. KBW01]|nr:hypothetical protein DBR40_07250 [Pedobacter sp. KBW01]
MPSEAAKRAFAETKHFDYFEKTVDRFAATITKLSMLQLWYFSHFYEKTLSRFHDICAKKTANGKG